jgi:outer membrane protein assembly factor BamE (lipoprotein component of BamABCDE complex)
MRPPIFTAVLLSAVVFIQGGCAHKAHDPGIYSTLKPGMTKAEVQDTLGKPTQTEIHGTTEIWQYDRPDHINSRTDRVEVYFENGQYKKLEKSTISS